MSEQSLRRTRGAIPRPSGRTRIVPVLAAATGKASRPLRMDCTVNATTSSSLGSHAAAIRYRLLLAGAIVGLIAGALPVTVAAQPPQSIPEHHGQLSEEQIRFFEARIRPVLIERCYGCHSAKATELRGGLRVDTAAGLLQGGESGAAVVPGVPEESLLLRALRYEDYEMPPDGPLPEAVVADFEQWIRMGAPDPRTAALPSSARLSAEEFWAFQRPRKIAPPQVRDTNWPYTAVDRFLLARLEQEGLRPVRDADPAALLRRVTFDLTGLPPTPEALEEFLRDPGPDSYRRVVDELLESPQFGQRWGRHWLDVARYADSMGKTRNVPFPHAWRYRNYVVDAFNDDLPFDQFIIQQLAGDLLSATSPDQRQRQWIATGFLAVGSHDLNQGNVRDFRMEVVAEQIDVTTRGLLGLTVACARCHDHKFDPISTRDYYALAGIFASTELLNGYSNRVRPNESMRSDRLVSLDPESLAQIPQSLRRPLERTGRAGQLVAQRLEQQLQQLRRQLASARRPGRRGAARAEGGEATSVAPAQLRRQIALLEQRAARLAEATEPIELPGPYAMGVVDSLRIQDCAIHIGGDARQLGETVPRGVLPALGGPAVRISSQTSGRLELARWIASPKNPLTARVMVNRVWHHLFGQGIVPTVDNFGQSGQLPSHPELLDWLAVDFVENGWSIKSLIRTLVLGHAYQLSTDYDPVCAERDADNVLRWRMQPRRLEFEAIRDAMLMISGRLEMEQPNESPLAESPGGMPLDRVPLRVLATRSPLRSVYLPVVRGRLPEEMTVLDFPEPSEPRGRRDVTTVPSQALFFMNHPLVIQSSMQAARRLVQTSGDQRRVQRVYREVVGRDPTPDQVRRIIAFVDRYGRQLTEVQAWALVYQAMFASAEFRYRG